MPCSEKWAKNTRRRVPLGDRGKPRPALTLKGRRPGLGFHPAALAVKSLPSAVSRHGVGYSSCPPDPRCPEQCPPVGCYPADCPPPWGNLADYNEPAAMPRYVTWQPGCPSVVREGVYLSQLAMNQGRWPIVGGHVCPGYPEAGVGRLRLPQGALAMRQSRGSRRLRTSVGKPRTSHVRGSGRPHSGVGDTGAQGGHGPVSFPSGPCGGACDPLLGVNPNLTGCAPTSRPTGQYYGFRRGRGAPGGRQAPYPVAQQPYFVGRPIQALIEPFAGCPTRGIPYSP